MLKTKLVLEPDFGCRQDQQVSILANFVP